MRPLIFLDTETTGLDPAKHEVWEIAYASLDGEIERFFVEHDVGTADPKALDLGGYHARYKHPTPLGRIARIAHEISLRNLLRGATLVGSNPAFDAEFLSRRWDRSPWHHRLLDIATFAMPALGYDRPMGLATIAHDLGIEAPDHTAAGDVHVLRESYRVLADTYNMTGALL